MSALNEQAKRDEQDFATIREILKSGGSLPFELQRKYDRHMEEIHIGLRALAGEQRPLNPLAEVQLQNFANRPAR